MDGLANVSAAAPEIKYAQPVRQQMIRKVETPMKEAGSKEPVSPSENLAPGTEDLPVRVSNREQEKAEQEKKEKESGPMASEPSRTSVSYRDAQYGYDKEINRFTVTITDRESNQVIKEIPPEETKKTLAALKAIQGNYIDQGI